MASTSSESCKIENKCVILLQVLEIAGHKVRAMRLSFVGELGWELHAPNNAALDVYNALFQVGKELGLRNSGYRAMDSLSMEKGERDTRRSMTPFSFFKHALPVRLLTADEVVCIHEKVVDKSLITEALWDTVQFKTMISLLQGTGCGIRTLEVMTVH